MNSLVGIFNAHTMKEGIEVMNPLKAAPLIALQAQIL